MLRSENNQLKRERNILEDTTVFSAQLLADIEEIIAEDKYNSHATIEHLFAFQKKWHIVFMMNLK